MLSVRNKEISDVILWPFKRPKRTSKFAESFKQRSTKSSLQLLETHDETYTSILFTTNTQV